MASWWGWTARATKPPSPFTGQSLQAMLQQFGVILPPGVTMQPRNIAAVMVTAQLPAFAQPGQQLDVNVSSIGNSRACAAAP